MEPSRTPRSRDCGRAVWPSPHRWLAICGAVALAAAAFLASVDAQSASQLLLIVDTGTDIDTFCVEASIDEMSVGELMALADLDYVSVDEDEGVAVCRIGDVGCDYPNEDCHCDCEDGGSCVAWHFWVWEDNAWISTGRTDGDRVVASGDIVAWVFGSADAEPPIIALAEVCGSPSEQTASALGATPESGITIPAEPTETPEDPTETPEQPTATQTPFGSYPDGTPTSIPTLEETSIYPGTTNTPTRTRTATATDDGAATATRTPTRTLTRTPTGGPTPTNTPVSMNGDEVEPKVTATRPPSGETPAAPAPTSALPGAYPEQQPETAPSVESADQPATGIHVSTITRAPEIGRTATAPAAQAMIEREPDATRDLMPAMLATRPGGQSATPPAALKAARKPQRAYWAYAALMGVMGLMALYIEAVSRQRRRGERSPVSHGE